MNQSPKTKFKLLAMGSMASLRGVVQLPVLVAIAVLGYGKEYECMAQ